jgi:hypothetical protein
MSDFCKNRKYWLGLGRIGGKGTDISQTVHLQCNYQRKEIYLEKSFVFLPQIT